MRELRIAAVGDIHFDGKDTDTLRRLFSGVERDADILVLCGDLTTRGDPEHVEILLDELHFLRLPMVAVLGNHDFEMDQQNEIRKLMEDAGVHLLDGTGVELQGVGFAGVKGFGGGFGRRTLGPFGERIYKDFVQTAIDEALKLETALRSLHTETRVVVLHYSPVAETLRGEPVEIFPFLGTSRLLTPIETYGASVVFHGHAHAGTSEAVTPAGIPVYNVARPVLERENNTPYRIWTVKAPERRSPGFDDGRQAAAADSSMIHATRSSTGDVSRQK
ncbi:MAG: metallophosphoesterase [Gemmatimonadota bacterium]|jgi:Icc-related predicted phosphoesterase|nr:metallophosphoesterase [Gemmatimonadota bacterium]